MHQVLFGFSHSYYYDLNYLLQIHGNSLPEYYLYMIAHMIAWSDEVADCHRVWKLFSETTLTWPFFLKSRPEIDRDLSDIGLFPLLDLEKSII